MKLLRTQYPQDMDIDQKDAHKQSNERKDTQKQTATVTEQNGILGQRKHYNNTELNIMIMSKNSEHNDGHFQQVRRVSAILIHLIPIE